jgi:hypothetical protein
MIADRFQKMDTHPTITIVNMKGESNQEYVLLIRDSPKAQYWDQEGWPETPEENLEHLKSCGVEVDRKVMFCYTCHSKLSP